MTPADLKTLNAIFALMDAANEHEANAAAAKLRQAVKAKGLKFTDLELVPANQKPDPYAGLRHAFDNLVDSLEPFKQTANRPPSPMPDTDFGIKMRDGIIKGLREALDLKGKVIDIQENRLKRQDDENRDLREKLEAVSTKQKPKRR